MPDEPIRYFNRYTGRVETELVYGEAWLRLSLHHPLGKFTMRAMGCRPWFAAWYGWWMSRASSRARIAPFIARYGINAAEFAQPPDAFASFNDFFSRKLKSGARPVDADPKSVVFPADGRHLGFDRAAAVSGVFVKGQRFDLETLLGDRALAARYGGGAIVFSRLCPVDYHRFHFPVAGTPSSARAVRGVLSPVNVLALRRRIEILWTNRRWITQVQSEHLGIVLVVEIGATNVGSTVQTFSAGAPAAKGGEKGYFQFGGSAMVTLFEPGRVKLADDLIAHSGQQRELYAHMGDRLGMAL